MDIDQIAAADRHKQAQTNADQLTRPPRASADLTTDADPLTATGSPRASADLKTDADQRTATTSCGGSGGLGPPGRYRGQRRRCPKGTKQARPARGRYWDRTSDLLGVNEALSR